MQRKVYILENLDCANCAAKIERKLSKLPELSDVSVTFATSSFDLQQKIRKRFCQKSERQFSLWNQM